MTRTLLVCLLLLFGSLANGQKRTFSINFENESFEAVLELVSTSTGYLFAYNSEIVPEGNRFSIKVEDVTIEEFLNKFLLGTGLEHQMLQDQVIIKETVIEPFNQNPKVSFSISGRVLDSLTSEPIPSVNVFLSETNIGGVTDLEGYNTIDRIPVGSYEVLFTHLSYEMETELVSRLSPGI
ncbi:MAG: STN and carboxypeptidase regulatory-like domain-containing protein, partial [Cyclobacteriaceae bacterium]